ncbi:M20 family metallopeptidase [Enterocloster citroniae]
MDIFSQVEAWIDENREQEIEFLQHLIQIPSINPWFSDYREYTTEKNVQEFLAESLQKLGFSVRLWETSADGLKDFEGYPGYYKDRPMHDRPILYACYKGTGNGRSLLLTGHADVVKVGEGWTRDPFGASIEGNQIYGRGAVDMKGGIAAMIMAARAVIENRIELRGDIQVNTVPDEEAGGMGSLDYVHRGIHSDGAIMTEPTDLQIGPMCRGILWGRIIIPGRAGHIEMEQSHWSQGGSVDAVKLLQLYLNQIDHFNGRWATKKVHPLMNIPCQLLVAGVHAGEYPSAYAGSAEIIFDAQYLPRDLDDHYRGTRIKAEIEDFVARVADTDEWLREHRPHVEWLLDADCAETPADGEFVKTMIQGAEKIKSPVTVKGLGAHSDMGWYVHKGIPTVNFGPGSPLIAHQADEYLDLDQYITSIKMLAAMIINWCQ